MRKDIEKDLVRKFPIIFCDTYGDPIHTCMSFGIETGNGWYQIIHNLSEKLEAIAESQPKPKKNGPIKNFFWPYVYSASGPIFNEFPWKSFPNWAWNYVYDYFEPKTDNRLKYAQIKEKLGILRIYIDGATEEAYEAVKEAEEASRVVCEDCGEPGKLRRRGWMRTLCDEHAGPTDDEY